MVRIVDGASILSDAVIYGAKSYTAGHGFIILLENNAEDRALYHDKASFNRDEW